jgi:GH15 family glucan-1,4-alpha-glucosidase
MAWVAFDRAIKDVETFALDGPVEHWRQVRDAIHAQVCAEGYNARRNTFVQSYGSPHLDASLLLIPQVGFLPPTDPRVQGTIAAVERDLLVDGLVMRYRNLPSLELSPPGEGQFLACSFWLADALLLLGRKDEGERLFDRLLSLRNDVGLLSEEYDVSASRLVGNFPQAFSHIALVNTAQNIARPSMPAEQRAGESKPGA